MLKIISLLLSCIDNQSSSKHNVNCERSDKRYRTVADVIWELFQLNNEICSLESKEIVIIDVAHSKHQIVDGLLWFGAGYAEGE